MVIQGVQNPLGINFTGTDDVALILLSLETKLGESLRHGNTQITLTVAQFISLLANLEIDIALHTDELFLSFAAAILNSGKNTAIATFHSSNNLLSTVPHLIAETGNTCTDVAATIFEGIVVNIQHLGKFPNISINAHHGTLDAIGVLIILQLSADSLKLVLNFDILLGLAIATTTFIPAAHEATSEHHPNQISEWVVPLLILTQHGKSHGIHVMVALVSHGSNSQGIMVVVSTRVVIAIDLFSDFVFHNFGIFKSL